ncbi:hypothetical protein [Variovorax paradoxus]|uniref:Uncharacterized protein n=1 Tax=Variovorax paradoxus TaxID=34073 RepID=A0A679JSJ9_VARPD|nr:hypothetical protein VVAX_06551 [Variovorax paradoxus]
MKLAHLHARLLPALIVACALSACGGGSGGGGVIGLPTTPTTPTSPTAPTQPDTGVAPVKSCAP